MKITCKSLSFSIFAMLLSILRPVCAEEGNCLDDACGYLNLSHEQVGSLNGWNKSKEICIGSSDRHSKQFDGNVGISRNDPFNHLSVTFEKDENMCLQNDLVAEVIGIRHIRSSDKFETIDLPEKCHVKSIGAAK